MLYNIFGKKSKEKENSAKKPQIVIDIHEKNSLVPSFLTELGGELIVQPLEVGDYLIGEVIIERKTYSDFISSMLSKRLVQQLGNMQQYAKRILILEGEQNREMEKDSKLNPNAIRGMILSASLDFQIPIVKTKNEEETAIYLFLLAKRQDKPKQEYSLHSRIPKTLEEQRRYVLESFPGIGPNTAKKLLEKFKSIKNIINLPPRELEKEIGKKAEQISRLLE